MNYQGRLPAASGWRFTVVLQAQENIEKPSSLAIRPVTVMDGLGRAPAPAAKHKAAAGPSSGAP